MGQDEFRRSSKPNSYVVPLVLPLASRLRSTAIVKAIPAIRIEYKLVAELESFFGRFSPLASRCLGY